MEKYEVRKRWRNIKFKRWRVIQFKKDGEI